MKKFALFFGIIVFLDLFYFATINWEPIVTITHPPLWDSYNIKMGSLLLITALSGAAASFMISYYEQKNLEVTLKKHERKFEKASVQTEESSDKVKLLEAKIKTLETALEEALKH